MLFYYMLNSKNNTYDSKISSNHGFTVSNDLFALKKCILHKQLFFQGIKLLMNIMLISLIMYAFLKYEI